MLQRKSPQDLLARAVGLHQRGALGEAIQGYKRFLKGNPRHAGALNLLGLAHFQSGAAEQGAKSVAAALALDPKLPGAAFNLGRMLQGLGRSGEAAEAYEKALTLTPRDAEALNNLGTTLTALGRHDDAIQRYRQAIAIKPDYAAAHYNLANALQNRDRDKEAVPHYEKALALDPRLAEAHIGLGDALRALGRLDDAVAHYRRAIALDPALEAAHYELGKSMAALGRFEDALASYRQVPPPGGVSGTPVDRAELNLNAGYALQELGRPAESIPHYEQALALKPDYVDAHVNLGHAYMALNREAEAIARFERAKALDPLRYDADVSLAQLLHGSGRSREAEAILDRVLAERPSQPNARNFKSSLCLSLGRLADGWQHFDTHWAVSANNHPRCYSQPEWDGGPIPGVLLLWGDQGLGDQILYAGVVPEFAGRAPGLVLEVEPRLVPLFARSFPGVEIGPTGAERGGARVEAQSPLSSVVKFVRPALEAIPKREAGYLVADTARANALRERLAGGGQAVIGLSWVSKNPYRGMKSMALRELEPLLRLPGCRFVDLQYGDTAAEREQVERELGVRVERLADIDNTNDIDGLAALMQACDAVVSVSNTSAHLAGALGRPAWVLVPHGPSQIWYWFKQGDDSPWYPRVRVHRQQASQRWPGVAAAVAGELRDWLNARRPPMG